MDSDRSIKYIQIIFDKIFYHFSLIIFFKIFYYFSKIESSSRFQPTLTGNYIFLQRHSYYDW